MVILVNEEDRITSFDPSVMSKIFGYCAKELIGADIRRLLPEMSGKSHEELRARFRTHPKGMGPGFDHGVSGRRKDGKDVPLDLLIAEGRDKVGARCFTWVMRGVTERVMLNSELSAIVV